MKKLGIQARSRLEGPPSRGPPLGGSIRVPTVRHDCRYLEHLPFAGTAPGATVSASDTVQLIDRGALAPIALPTTSTLAHGIAQRINVRHPSISLGASAAARKREGHMFTRRQAIRWAELWVSCWNEGDFDTLLALYKRHRAIRTPVERQSRAISRQHDRGVQASLGGGAVSAFTPFAAIWSACRGIPETRELTIVYATDIGGTQLHGCDLVTLDADGRVVLGEPCVGCVVDDELGRAPSAARLRHATQRGRRTVMRIMAALRLARGFVVGAGVSGVIVSTAGPSAQTVSADRKRRIRCAVRSSACRTTGCSTSWRSGSNAAP